LGLKGGSVRRQMWQTRDVAEEGAVVLQHESFERKQVFFAYRLFQRISRRRSPRFLSGGVEPGIRVVCGLLPPARHLDLVLCYFAHVAELVGEYHHISEVYDGETHSATAKLGKQDSDGHISLSSTYLKRFDVPDDKLSLRSLAPAGPMYAQPPVDDVHFEEPLGGSALAATDQTPQCTIAIQTSRDALSCF
jgi:hypothetical protein